MPNSTAEAFAARMKLLASQDFGSQSRPQLAAAVANGSASPDDMARIASFVSALDAVKVARANANAGIFDPTNPQDADLMTSVGESNAIVQRANTTLSDTKYPAATRSFLEAVGGTVSKYAANSGSLVFPQPTGFQGEKAAKESESSPIQKIWHGLLFGLNEIGNVPGFIYRGMNLAGSGLSGPVGSDKWAENVANMALGMDKIGEKNNNLGAVDFLWNHGEADFNNLQPVIDRHGSSMVNTAVGLFYNKKGYGGSTSDAMNQYMSGLDDKLRAGDIDEKQYAAEIKNLNSPDFQQVYDAVDRQHVSFGRDLARTFINDTEHPGLFNKVSGGADFAWSMFADPTLVIGKTARSIKFAKYGADALADPSKVSRLYGVADKVTGEIPQVSPVFNRGAYVARRNVQDFLDRNGAIRAAEAEGNHAQAAALLAQQTKRHPDLMPAYREAQGYRMAVSPAERSAAAEAGDTMTLGGDATHQMLAPARGGRTAEERAANAADFKAASLPVLKTKPIETIDEWADWLVTQGGLYRMWSGLAPNQMRLLPGLMGFAAEARAATVSKLAYRGTVRGLNSGKLGSLIDLSKHAGKVIPSDEGEAFKTAFAARGAAQNALIGGRSADGWLGFARSVKARSEQTARRLTTLLPTNHIIAFNSAQAGKDVERFARTYLPAYESSLVRYLWEQAPTEAGRRQIGKALVNSVAEASGLTRSVVGRQFIDGWNADFDAINARRYGLGDTDVIPDALNGGDRRVALHMSQIETHLLLPKFTDMRIAAAKGAILGFDKQLGDIVAHGHSDWFKDAQGAQDTWGGIQRMLMSPSATVRYGLFNNRILTRAFGLMKLGWLGTTSNMLRQLGEEYTGIKLSGHGSTLRLGKRTLRLNDDVSKAVTAAHHLIPRDMRKDVTSENDVYEGIIKGRLKIAWGDRPLDPAEERAVKLAAERIAKPEVHDLIGGRQATQAEGGVEDAVAAHREGVQQTRIGWKAPGGKFQGYSEAELEGDNGRKALAAMYTQRFLDEDEPARRALAYLMWNQAAENPKFLAKLDEKTLKLMEELVVPDRDAEGKLLGASTQALKDYVGKSEKTALFRKRAEYLNHDENGYQIHPDDQVAQDGALERYVHNLIADVAGVTFRKSGKGMHANLVSDLLHGSIPSESELAKISLKDLPDHVIRAEFAPAPGGKIGEFGEGVTQFATKVFDHIVTNPMTRLERKPLYIGHYVEAFKRLQGYEEKLVTDFGFKPTEAERIIDQMAAGQAMHDTLRYIDNPRVASQFSAVAQNFWLFFRAQEDWARRWSRLVKERPEMIRMVHAGIISGQNSGMIDRDSDGNLILAYPGSGALVDAFLHAGNALGLVDDKNIKLPVVHDLTTQVNYLNPSLMNPVGFSATPMLAIPFDMLGAAIPGSDLLKAQADMAMEGQLGNGRHWWEQFLPTAINRVVQLSPLDGSSDNTASHVGSAAATAILNATLAGQMDGSDDDVIRQHKIADLKTQTLNSLYSRALFSFMAPGATSMPELDYTNDKGELSNPEADYAWRVRGIQDLHEEYLAMIQAFGVQKANVVWADLHPDKLIYSVGKTATAAKGAVVDPTTGAAQWIFDHKELFAPDSPYSKVAAYFTPSAPGTFDQTAWNALTEMGIRQYKDVSQYYIDIASKNGVTAWFNAKDKYDLALAQAKASGDDHHDLDKAYDDAKQKLYLDYPILKSYFDNSAARADQRRQAVNELRQMASDPAVQLPDLQGVAQMLTVMDNYNRQVQAIKGQRNTNATATRQALKNAYDDTMNAIVKKFPGLTDVYQGVFRELDS